MNQITLLPRKIQAQRRKLIYFFRSANRSLSGLNDVLENQEEFIENLKEFLIDESEPNGGGEFVEEEDEEDFILPLNFDFKSVL